MVPTLPSMLACGADIPGEDGLRMGGNLMTIVVGPLDDGSPLRVRVVNRPFIKIVSSI